MKIGGTFRQVSRYIYIYSFFENEFVAGVSNIPVHILTSNNGIMIIYCTRALAKTRFRAADVIIAVYTAKV